MEKQPVSIRRHVVLLGKTNAGKSTLFNALTGQDNAIVSPHPGTTTDPVKKAMELVPFGPIMLIDTAGSDDYSGLGYQRMGKTNAVRRRADAALYVVSAADFSREDYESFRGEGLPHLLVLTKTDLATRAVVSSLSELYPGAVLWAQGESPELLREKLSVLLESLQPEDMPLLGDLLPAGANVVLVTPIDSEAPKGRLIMPQVQVLRDCLDHGIKATVCRETELAEVLANLRSVDLVVTDSQVFGQVNRETPPELPLTSFSMLLARQKGDFEQLLEGAKTLETLRDGAEILMLEGCTHNHTHEDIGRIKIPAMLQKRIGGKLNFTYYSGYDFPEELSGYSLAVQCGSCMLNRREVAYRLAAMNREGLPVTNYGILLAWANGILARAGAIFQKGEREHRPVCNDPAGADCFN